MALLQRYAILIVLLIFIGCKKQSPKPPVITPPDTKPVYKIEVVQGDNQTDTVGHPLKDDIQLKFYKDGKPLVNATVLFRGSGCIAKDSVYTVTITGGIAGTQWYLSSDVGVQTMKVVLCDSAKNHLDSLYVHATALQSSGKGILACACGFGGGGDPHYPTFYKLHSGRIIASSAGLPKYSDDNGLSWYPINTMANFALRKMVITPDDKIFALINEGVIYSTDKGMNWLLLVRDDPYHIKIYDIDYTRGGILSYSINGIMYISADNGKTWKKVEPQVGGNPLGFSQLTQQINGDLYLLSGAGGLYKSTDDGTNWTFLNSNTEFYSSIFIDDNGYMYLGRTGLPGGIYLSKDNAQTITQLNFTPNVYDNFFDPDWMSKQHDGYYYIHTQLEGTFRTKDFVNIENVNTRFNVTGDCIVADNNNLILSAGKYDEYSYIPNQ